MGAYFHPSVLHHTLAFLNATASMQGVQNLWDHPNFVNMKPLRFFGSTFLGFIAKRLKNLTCGSILCGQEYSLWKDVESDMSISTARSREAGYVGFQKVPWIGNIGKISVFTGSGNVQNANGGHELISHISLPATKQYENVALICYHPGSSLMKLKFDSDVYAYFPLDLYKAAGFEVVKPSSSKHTNKSTLGWVFVRAGSPAITPAPSSTSTSTSTAAAAAADSPSSGGPASSLTSYLALGCNKMFFDVKGANPVSSYDENCYWVVIMGSEAKLGMSFEKFQSECQAITGNYTNKQLKIKCPSSLCYATKGNNSNNIKQINDATAVLVCEWELGKSEFKNSSTKGSRAYDDENDDVESGGGGGGGGEDDGDDGDDDEVEYTKSHPTTLSGEKAEEEEDGGGGGEGESNGPSAFDDIFESDDDDEMDQEYEETDDPTDDIFVRAARRYSLSGFTARSSSKKK
jgi:hypothetical protein